MTQFLYHNRGLAGLSILLLTTALSLLASLSSALHFPGLISKDYTYDQTLAIKQSFYLTTKGKSDIIQEVTNKLQALRYNFAPRFPVTEAFDMCHPSFGKESVSTTESAIAGYFGISSHVTTSAYSAPLKHGIPLDYDEKKHLDGHDKCITLCEREWSVQQVSMFTKLV